jgi:hypothetical protein
MNSQKQQTQRPATGNTEFDLQSYPIDVQLNMLGISKQGFYSFYDELCKRERIPAITGEDTDMQERRQILLFLKSYKLFNQDYGVNTAMLCQFDNLVNTQYAIAGVSGAKAQGASLGDLEKIVQ